MDSRYSARAWAGMELFFLPWMRRRVAAVRIAGLPDDLPPLAPLLLVANHVSWWDGFLIREVQRRLRPDAPMYTVMLEPELRRRPFLRRLGAVGIDPAAPASVARTLRLLRARRDETPGAMFVFFPQGRIWPSHRRPLGFRRGVELFARRLAPVTVLPVGMHLEPLNSPASTAFVSIGEPLRVRGAEADAEALERRVEAELDRILAFLAEHGEEAARAWPAALPAPAPAAEAEAGA